MTLYQAQKNTKYAQKSTRYTQQVYKKCTTSVTKVLPDLHVSENVSLTMFLNCVMCTKSAQNREHNWESKVAI